jgi:hypothetical protein
MKTSFNINAQCLKYMSNNTHKKETGFEKVAKPKTHGGKKKGKK